MFNCMEDYFKRRKPQALLIQQEGDIRTAIAQKNQSVWGSNWDETQFQNVKLEDLLIPGSTGKPIGKLFWKTVRIDIRSCEKT